MKITTFKKLEMLSDRHWHLARKGLYRSFSDYLKAEYIENYFWELPAIGPVAAKESIWDLYPLTE
jgi:hypothetical protein